MITEKRIEQSKSNMFVANCQLHEFAKLNQSDFLNKIKDVKALRCSFALGTGINLSIYPCGKDWERWQWVHTFISGIPIFPTENEDFVFGLFVPDALYHWIKNLPLDIVRKQIVCYLATLYASDTTKLEIMRDQLDPLFFTDMLVVYDSFWKAIQPQLKEDECVDDSFYWGDNYKKMFENYIGCEPPFLLWRDNPKYDTISILRVESKQDRLWGIGTSYDHRFTVRIDSAYMREDDWKAIVLRDLDHFSTVNIAPKGITKKFKKLNKAQQAEMKIIARDYCDPLKRSESEEVALLKWGIVYRSYPLSKNNTYIKFELENKSKGFVYLIQTSAGGPVKIGFSTNAEERLASLQTAHPEKLKIVGAFSVSGRHSEGVLHRKFKSVRQEGEWFALSEIDIENILNADWRNEQGIF